MRLERLGRMPWPEARTLLAGTTCTWADLHGFHIEPADRLPAEVPQSTHLWAWADDRCVRVRVDGTDALVAVLRPDGRPGTAVSIRTRPGLPWGADDKQVGPLPPGAHSLRFELLELLGPSPATFVRATAP
jgi:hypothetical protein